jgi:hypothetical protein
VIISASPDQLLGDRLTRRDWRTACAARLPLRMAGRREFLGGCLATTSLLVGCTAPPRAASPYGPRGGTGPGGVGNHIITAHRLSSTRAFWNLPKVKRGAKVHLVADGRRCTYEIVPLGRRRSARSARSPSSRRRYPGIPADARPGP